MGVDFCSTFCQEKGEAQDVKLVLIRSAGFAILRNKPEQKNFQFVIHPLHANYNNPQTCQRICTPAGKCVNWT
jgi:hypothetical protein